jgi:hypothetical protein
MSGYGTVVGGKLKLKKPGGAAVGPVPARPAAAGAGAAAAPAAGAAAPRPPAAAAGAGAAAPAPASAPAATAGVKRRADEVDGGSSPGSGAGGGGGGAAPAAAGGGGAGGGGAGGAAPAAPSGAPGKTAAQLAFEEASRKRLREAAAKSAATSYRDKVAAVNAGLEKLPEHNDLFRIQYAGSG